MTKTKFIESLVQELSLKHMLKHPFYQRWTMGELTTKDMQVYSQQYFQHVDAFPRYVSATHSQCKDIKARQVLLENLIEEERGEKNHPELWMQFAKAMGASRESVVNADVLPETRALVDTFMNLSRSSYAEGLGALYAYEHQIPEVSATKIEGLKKFYGLDHAQAKPGLEFFEVHLEADKWHSEVNAQLMDELSDEDKKKATHAAKSATDALWKFLDGVNRVTAR